jgi:hypothetical protein
MNVLSMVGTARTFAANFWPWLVGAFVIGAAASTYPTFLVTRAVYQRATLKAEKELSDWKGAAAQERLDAKVREAKIMSDAKGIHDEQVSAINTVADELHRLAAGVQVCTSVSTMRVSQPAAGSSQPVESREPRPAEIVLQEFAAEFARRADTNAAAYNSLMERWEKIAAKLPQ